MEKVCFIFKNNKEANFYFKEMKMKLSNKGYKINDKDRCIILPDFKNMNFFKRILAKLNIYDVKVEEVTLYLFRSKHSEDTLKEYERYYFLDDIVDYIPQFMELMF